MSKVVFVGNVPYNMNEDTLIDVFKKVGTVVGFRLVFDRETGKPRGYGFCEFADHETAQSAVRNLNNVDCGGRPLRIDLADSDPFLEGKTTMRGELVDSGGGWRGERREGAGPGADRERHGVRGGFGSGGGTGGGGPDWLSSLPRGTPLPPGMNCMDAISQTVAGIRPGQMMEILGAMKGYILDQPDKARTLLTSQPQLAYALFQALLVNQIVDPAILHRMIAATAQNAAGGSAPPPPPPPPVHQHAPPLHTHNPVPVSAAPPPALPAHLLPHAHTQSPYPHQQPPPPNIYGLPPPSTHMGYQPPASSAPPPPPPPPTYYQPQSQPPPAAPAPTTSSDPVSVVPESQRAMLMQMLSLTNEQINALPPNERAAIQHLKSQFMALGSNLGS